MSMAGLQATGCSLVGLTMRVAGADEPPFGQRQRPGSDDPRTPGGRAGWLDQVCAEGQAGQVGAAAAAGLVPDPVQMRADRADADVQLGGDLRVGPAPGDQDDQLPLPGTELPRAW